MSACGGTSNLVDSQRPPGRSSGTASAIQSRSIVAVAMGFRASSTRRETRSQSGSRRIVSNSLRDRNIERRPRRVVVFTSMCIAISSTAASMSYPYPSDSAATWRTSKSETDSSSDTSAHSPTAPNLARSVVSTFPQQLRRIASASTGSIPKASAAELPSSGIEFGSGTSKSESGNQSASRTAASKTERVHSLFGSDAWSKPRACSHSYAVAYWVGVISAKAGCARNKARSCASLDSHRCSSQRAAARRMMLDGTGTEVPHQRSKITEIKSTADRRFFVWVC